MIEQNPIEKDFFDSLGLSFDEGSKEDICEDLSRATKEYSYLQGKLQGANERLMNGLVIDFQQYETMTKKKWLLEGYLKDRINDL